MLSKDLYERIVASAYDGILVTDRSGRIVFANQTALESFHRTEAEVVGKTPDDMNRLGIYSGSSIKDAMRSGQVVTKIIKMSDHQRLSTSIPIIDEYGELEMVVTYSRADELLNEYSRQLAYEQSQHTLYREMAEYLSSREQGQRLIYRSRQLAEVVETCNSVARTESSVLITGESGVGKEIVARMLHNLSPRRDEAFIPINCSAIPGELFESEFYGYMPGAFTGANAKGKVGLVQMANRGTIFLDELGEMPLLMQSKLLRSITTGEFYPVGSSKPEKVSVRVIAATNRDLYQMVREKSFREDLYYRISVIPIYIPPLRERPEDVDVLAVYYLEHFNRKHRKEVVLSDFDMEVLRRYPWPGNVRELRNTIERAVILSSSVSAGPSLRAMLSSGSASGAPPALSAPARSFTAQMSLDLPLDKALEQFESRYIDAVVARHHGKLGAAADSLGIHRSTLYRKQKGG